MPNGSGPGQAEVAATCAWGAFAVVPGASVAPESVVCPAAVASGGDRVTAKLVSSTSAGVAEDSWVSTPEKWISVRMASLTVLRRFPTALTKVRTGPTCAVWGASPEKGRV